MNIVKEEVKCVRLDEIGKAVAIVLGILQSAKILKELLKDDNDDWWESRKASLPFHQFITSIMKRKVYLITLLLVVFVGLGLMLFNIINWLTYFIILLVVGALTQVEKRRNQNDQKK